MLTLFVVQHNVNDDCIAAGVTRLKGHGGADFFAVDAFVTAVSVCIDLLSFRCIITLICICSFKKAIKVLWIRKVDCDGLDM